MRKTAQPTAPICFRVPQEQFDALKRLARRKAMAEDRDVSTADLCREAIERMYPAEEFKLQEQREQDSAAVQAVSRSTIG